MRQPRSNRKIHYETHGLIWCASLPRNARGPRLSTRKRRLVTCQKCRVAAALGVR